MSSEKELARHVGGGFPTKERCKNYGCAIGRALNNFILHKINSLKMSLTKVSQKMARQPVFISLRSGKSLSYIDKYS